MNAEFKDKVRSLVSSRVFEFFIMIIILFNSIVIGLETYERTDFYDNINFACLIIYTIEISLRFYVSESVKSFFKSGWNVFDLFIVVVGFIPEDVSSNSGVVAVLRVLRVFRVFRLFKTNEELKLIVTVMIRSMRALVYNALVMFIFMYVFAIAGVYLFKLPTPDTATAEQMQQLQLLKKYGPPAPSNADDPYGSLTEAMFTLLRCISGDDWSDLRYNLITASRMNLIPVPPVVVSIYHIFWYVFGAFLLINLIVGAVINNYKQIWKRKRKKDNDRISVSQKEKEAE